LSTFSAESNPEEPFIICSSAALAGIMWMLFVTETTSVPALGRDHVWERRRPAASR
jgi:hypothetical protein